MEGFIYLHRQLLESFVFCNPNHLKIWIWCLLKANHKDLFVSVKIGAGQGSIKVKKGQFIFGRFKAEEELNLNGSMIYRTIQKFEQEGMILIEANNQYSIVTIVKWADYQGEVKKVNNQRTTIEQPLNNERTMNEQSLNINNNDNNDNNVKNNIYIPFLNSIFGRKETTQWSDKEKKALKLQNINNDDLQLIIKFYKSDYQYKRKDMITLLNNWNTEIDRANNYFKEQKEEKKHYPSASFDFGTQ